jgi:hypothetical protein
MMKLTAADTKPVNCYGLSVLRKKARFRQPQLPCVR